jgi:diacylglycerol kinase (ATP)
VPLGILPFGTFNNIAHSLGLPLELVLAAEVIAAGKTRDIDVGLANDTYFFEAAGVGLDASLFPIGEEIKGGHYEKLLQGAAALLGHHKVRFSLKVDDSELELNCPMIVIANGPYYGAGFTVAPQASLDDGMLDIVTFDCTKVEIARHFALSARNREHEEVCIMSFRAKEITLTPELDLAAHADGKPLGNVPLTCRVLPKALKVLVP